MKNLRHISLVVILTFLFSLISVQSQAISLFVNHMEDGKENYATYKYEMAINDFTEELKDNAKNAEAHRWIGMSYDKLNDYRNAIRNFKIAVLLDAEYNQKINKAIFELNPAHIAEMENTLKETAKKNSAFKNELNNFYFTNGEKDAVAGNLRDAEQWFSFAISLNPDQEQKVSNIYYELGHYELALKHNPNNDYARLALGKKYAQVAIDDWPNKGPAYYEAIELLGHEKVEEIFPKKETITTFKKTYTFDDAYDKKHGRVNTWNPVIDDVKVGDRVIIRARIIGSDKFHGEELYLVDAGNWVRTNNGKYSATINILQDDAYYMVSLDGRADVEFDVIVERDVLPKPKTEILAKL